MGFARVVDRDVGIEVGGQGDPHVIGDQQIGCDWAHWVEIDDVEQDEDPQQEDVHQGQSDLLQGEEEGRPDQIEQHLDAEDEAASGVL